jgi:hypothetical protein
MIFKFLKQQGVYFHVAGNVYCVNKTSLSCIIVIGHDYGCVIGGVGGIWTQILSKSCRGKIF